MSFFNMIAFSQKIYLNELHIWTFLSWPFLHLLGDSSTWPIDSLDLCTLYLLWSLNEMYRSSATMYYRSSDYRTWCHLTYSQLKKIYWSNASMYYRSSEYRTWCHLIYSHFFKKYRSNAIRYCRSSTNKTLCHLT